MGLYISSWAVCFFRINRQASTGHHMAGNASGGCSYSRWAVFQHVGSWGSQPVLLNTLFSKEFFQGWGHPGGFPGSQLVQVLRSVSEASLRLALDISWRFLKISWSIDHNSHLILGYQDLFGHVWTSHISKVPGVGCWMLASCCIY
jgi:hypothetical protein